MDAPENQNAATQTTCGIWSAGRPAALGRSPRPRRRGGDGNPQDKQVRATRQVPAQEKVSSYSCNCESVRRALASARAAVLMVNVGSLTEAR